MSAVWNKPVVGRSENDYLNVADLNRIEENIVYLATVLTDAGYSVTQYPSKVWDVTMVPTKADFTRIYNAITAITTAYHDWGRVDIQPFATKSLTHDIVDAVEKKLQDVKRLWYGFTDYKVNTHQMLTAYTHEQLGAYTYDQLQKQQTT